MARANIDGHIVLKFEESPKDKYWTAMSSFISGKYGQNKFDGQEDVENILSDCFNFLAEQFKGLVYEETSLSFVRYVFWLHEESIKLYLKTLSGTNLNPVREYEFAMYRRILKNVLEQSCDVDLVWGTFPTAAEVYRMDAKMQELIYVGSWLYWFADMIAMHKMVERYHYVDFRSADHIVIDHQYHYGKLYDELFPKLQEDYENAIFDENSVPKLIDAIDNCFGIEYAFARKVIFDIKAHHSTSNFQTIQPEILPQNLVAQYGITLESAKQFYDGLTLSRQTKMSLEDLVRKPYNMNRHMFRPILIYNIDGEDRALVGSEKFSESIMVLSTNAIQWNAMQPEWLQNKCMQLFLNRMGDEHDKLLEDAIETKIVENELLYVRNIKSFRQSHGDNININNEVAGEMDFIIINQRLKKVFVADSKYNRARYEAVGFRNDYSNFVKQYEPKLLKKVNWVKGHLGVVADHFKIKYNLRVLNITDYVVEGVFLLNTPTFYMFNGNYKAIPLNQFTRFITGRLPFKKFIYLNEDPDADNQYDVIEHPYFKR